MKSTAQPHHFLDGLTPLAGVAKSSISIPEDVALNDPPHSPIPAPPLSQSSSRHPLLQPSSILSLFLKPWTLPFGLQLLIPCFSLNSASSKACRAALPWEPSSLPVSFQPCRPTRVGCISCSPAYWACCLSHVPPMETEAPWERDRS